jgi:hypothetical protein
MPSPFSEWTYNDALQALNSRQRDGDEETLRYVVEHDNWQDGAGSSLPPFDGADAKTSAVLKRGTERNFTPKGTSASVVRRHRRGVVGREPGWMVGLRRKLAKVTTPEGEADETPTLVEQRVIDDAQELLLDWWNYHRGLKEFKKSVTYFKAVGRGTLRLYWAPADLQNGRMPTLPFKEALKKIYLLAPEPKEAAVILDKWSMRRAGVYTFEDKDGKSVIGLCYLDDKGNTVIKTLREGSTLTEQAPGLLQRAKDSITGAKPDAALPLNGNLTVFEMEGDPLITNPVKRQQRLEDKAYSMLSHNMDEAGFREEVYLNAQPPGKTVWIDDPGGSGVQVEAFIKGSGDTLEKGPGTTKFVRGVAYTEKDETTGKVKTYLATPSREVTDPVPVTSYIETASAARQNILSDTDQLHVEIAGDATANGVSRQQARDDYEKSLDETKSEVDYVGSAVMETFLCLVAIFAGKPGHFDGVRVSFDARVDSGPLSPEDRRMNIEEMEALVKTMEEARQYAGAADPDAVKQKILEEQAELAKVRPAPPTQPPPVEDKTGEGLPA